MTATESPRLRELSATQWKSGLAAWLGWLFDGLDMHLYTLVAAPFVATLLALSDPNDPGVRWYGSWIQVAFLVGWALGGGLFGRLGDRLGRSRALCLRILTYALFTGLSSIAQTWWQLLLFRFLAALGIRRAVPEPEEGTHAAATAARDPRPLPSGPERYLHPGHPHRLVLVARALGVQVLVPVPFV
ncbi:MAG TPA: MFS transporter [Isosphaeraceae bacterium]|nr:MFS transporter [Isosphaeraceae bacterium]